MTRHCATAAFLLVAILVTTVVALAMATAADQENRDLEYIGVREYLVTAKPPRATVGVGIRSYHLWILENALGISEKKAEKALVCSHPTPMPIEFSQFIVKLAPEQVPMLKHNSHIQRVVPKRNACSYPQDDMNN